MASRRAQVLPLFCALALGACGGGATTSSGALSPGGVASCAPVEGSLGAAATLGGMSGDYDLVLILPDDEAPTVAAGSLSLRSQPETLTVLAGASTPLGGSTDIDVGPVSSYRPDGLSSADPAAPGVLVIEDDGRDGRDIVLRLGSRANSRDLVAFDGAYMVLRVRSITRDGFVGAWESRGSRDRTSGHFCASRSGA